MKQFFITGISTEVGKTVASAIITEALEADYWKPVQAGELDQLDSSFVHKFTPEITIFKERYLLTEPMSPHAAANIDKISIALSDFELPDSDNLIVEGAGGLLVPINNKGETIADLIKQLNIPVVLVSTAYLGSINHTLLSIDYLKRNNIPVKGIIFNGSCNKDSEEIILSSTRIKLLGRIPKIKEVTQKNIEKLTSNITL